MDDSQLVDDLRSRFNAGEKLKFVFFWGHQSGKNGVTAASFSQQSKSVARLEPAGFRAHASAR
ncbi:hypothetical protein ACG04R_15850 [Roseateles sp. BYS78W]|uniref:Uncharacterized protein n=1 Tax=Pelomonas candidula TaxID=3299025 RepID=A0ABW7HE21_9BURK